MIAYYYIRNEEFNQIERNEKTDALTDGTSAAAWLCFTKNYTLPTSRLYLLRFRIYHSRPVLF